MRGAAAALGRIATGGCMGNAAADMKSGEQGSAKKGIPNAMTNKTGADKKFEGGKMSGICYTHDRKCYQD